MADSNGGHGLLEKLGDFTTEPRVLAISAMGLVAGTGGGAAGWVLLHLIALATSLAYLGHFTMAGPTTAHLPVWTIAVPVLGAVIIGLMARYGSEKIRGHGIPEALEAIMLGGSRMGLKVAILKPISSAISIGTGGPFGAEGPIIMTGGAIGSLFAQLFAADGYGAQDAAGRRRLRRHDGGVRHTGRRDASRGRIAPVRAQASKLPPRGRGLHHGCDRTALHPGTGALISLPWRRDHRSGSTGLAGWDLA